jgi:hypothetical protein
MNDRDKFAAAALTGLLAGRETPYVAACATSFAYSASRLADAMLAARGPTTDHDAAPAATASEAESPAGGRRAVASAGEAGTGDTMAAWHGVPVAWAAVASNGQPLWLAYNRQDAEGAVCGTVKVVPLYAAPPAAGPTLTAAERDMLTFVRDIFAAREDNELAFAIDGLLARAAKEER